ALADPHTQRRSRSFFNHPSPTDSSTLSLHDALPISSGFKNARTAKITIRIPVTIWITSRNSESFPGLFRLSCVIVFLPPHRIIRSEEHTSELQSRFDLVCRLLLEKKKHQWNVNRTRS